MSFTCTKLYRAVKSRDVDLVRKLTHCQCFEKQYVPIVTQLEEQLRTERFDIAYEKMGSLGFLFFASASLVLQEPFPMVVFGIVSMGFYMGARRSESKLNVGKQIHQILIENRDNTDPRVESMCGELGEF